MKLLIEFMIIVGFNIVDGLRPFQKGNCRQCAFQENCLNRFKNDIINRNYLLDEYIDWTDYENDPNPPIYLEEFNGALNHTTVSCRNKY